MTKLHIWYTNPNGLNLFIFFTFFSCCFFILFFTGYIFLFGLLNTIKLLTGVLIFFFKKKKTLASALAFFYIKKSYN